MATHRTHDVTKNKNKSTHLVTNGGVPVIP